MQLLPVYSIITEYFRFIALFRVFGYTSTRGPVPGLFGPFKRVLSVYCKMVLYPARLQLCILLQPGDVLQMICRPGKQLNRKRLQQICNREPENRSRRCYCLRFWITCSRSRSGPDWIAWIGRISGIFRAPAPALRQGFPGILYTSIL